MTEPELRALRDSLQESADPPAFDVIAGRRHRRTRGWASLGAACLTVAVFAGVAWGLHARGEGGTGPVAPQPTPSSALSTSVHASGTFFALDAKSKLVKYSTDKGRTWRRLTSGEHPEGRLAAANANSTWLVGSSEVRYISLNNWTGWPAADPGAFSVAKERLWLVIGAKVTIWTANRPRIETSPLPAPVTHVAALSAEAAMVMTLDGNDVAKWYYTFDSGAHWTARADPCDATATSSNVLASSRFTTMSAAPDRSLWTVCAGEPGAGQQPKELLVSTNDGETWQSRGKLESSGYGSAVYPVSKTAAWRSGSRADLYRTVDGTRWESVMVTEDGSGFEVAALDQETAIRLERGRDGGSAAHLTLDGGRTWTPVSF